MNHSLLPPLSDAWPVMHRCRQSFSSQALSDQDIASTIGQIITDLEPQLHKGDSVAITAGSRGIDRYALVIKALVSELIRRGAKPFVFPAMGSHGGASATGQTELLARFGIDEGHMACPIHSSMDVVELGQCRNGMPVFLDAHAAQAKHLIVVNRIKPHTSFRAPLESGLCKMLVIGAGKHAGAMAMHKRGWADFGPRLQEAAALALSHARVLTGIALLEDATHSLAAIHSLPPRQWLEHESALLQQAHASLPRLPVRDIDLLIVDRIGKNISGTGMDPNVIGRGGLPDSAHTPRIGCILVRGLHPQTHGNAIGIGMADLITQAVADAIDQRSTSINALTSLHPQLAATPITLKDDAAAIRLALDQFCQHRRVNEARVLHICDTLDLEHFQVSQALYQELHGHNAIDCDQDGQPMNFDTAGQLTNSAY